MAELDVKERQAGDVTILDMSGEVRIGDSSVALRDVVRKLSADGKNKILLNLAGVTYVDSAGLGQLVQAQTKASGSGARLKVASPGTRLLTLLKVAKLLPLFDITESEAAAIETLNATSMS